MKLSTCEDGVWVTHSPPATFTTEVMRSGGTRLVAAVPAGDAATFQSLAGSLETPCMLLYVLHTPRGEGSAGRYQSPPLSADELPAFITRYAAFLTDDARFDLWVHSPSQQATVVWDRHNLIYAYGPIERFVSTLTMRGFEEGEPGVHGEHMHHYREEYDRDAAAVLEEFAWIHSPLRPDDEQ